MPTLGTDLGIGRVNLRDAFSLQKPNCPLDRRPVAFTVICQQRQAAKSRHVDIGIAPDPRLPAAILPLGGVVGYKGTCLSMTVEILGGLLSGEGCAAGATVMMYEGAPNWPAENRGDWPASAGSVSCVAFGVCFTSVSTMSRV